MDEKFGELGICPSVKIQEWNEKNSCNRRVNHYATNFNSVLTITKLLFIRTTKINLPIKDRTVKGEEKRSERFR